MRAALALWKQAVKNSNIHPAEIPAVKAIFLYDGFLPVDEMRIDAIMETLEQDVVYATIAPSAKRYGISRQKLARELSKIEAVPVPGTTIYNLSDIITCVNRIRRREGPSRQA
jgi:hypothetical protein